MREVPLTFDIALGSRSIRLGHDDPADRFIAATAAVHGLTLVTADGLLLQCPDIPSDPRHLTGFPDPGVPSSVPARC